MAVTADSTSSNHHSPRASGFSGDGLSSPQLRRNSLSSPWVQVVLGESESVSEAVVQHSPSSPSLLSPPPSLTSISESTDKLSSSTVASVSSTPPPDNSMATENLDANNSSNAARPKKPAWNKPSNGGLEVGPVMGAVSWPALSESTKPSPKSSLADSSSSKSLSDGSVSNNQVPVISNLSSKITNPNASSSSNTNHAMAARQRSKRGGGPITSGGGPAHTGFTRSPRSPPPPPPLPQAFPNAMSPNGVGNLLRAYPDPSPIEPPYTGNNWETRQAGGFVSQSHPVNEHRSSSRRGNYGPRGDGTYHNNYGGRRERDRGNYANARDVHMQQQRGPPRGFIRPPPLNAGTFVAPQPIRPFVNPCGFLDFLYLPTHMEHFRPFMAAPVLMPVAEPPLQAMLVHQIDYYFSDENLAKDEFLKSNMDDQGWVPITLIASFPRVKNLTNNIQLILDSLRTSIVVEINEEKVRRRHDWMKYIPPSSRVLTESGLPSLSGSGYGAFTTSFQKITLEEEDKANPHSEDLHFSESTGQSKLCNGDGPELTLSNHS